MGIQERKEREKEQRRQDIISAGEIIFFSKGFDKATVDEVAKEAELSKGTVYLYFKSKEDLLFGVLQRGADVLRKMLDDVITEEKYGIENLIEMAGAFIRFSSEYENYFKIFLHFQNSKTSKLNIEDKQLQDYFVNQSPFSLLTKIVEKGITDKTLRDDIPVDILATTLWSQMMGLLVILENKRDLHELCNIQQTDILSAHFELIMNGAKGEVKIEIAGS